MILSDSLSEALPLLCREIRQLKVFRGGIRELRDEVKVVIQVLVGDLES